MAIYTSNLMKKEHRHRGIYSGKEYSVEGIIKIPSGTVLTTADVLKFAPIGENQVVTQVWAYCLGNAGATQVSIGYAQQLDEAGQPVVIYRNGPNRFAPSDSEFTSPVSDLDAYAPAAVLTTARRVVDTAVEKLAGPVDLACAITTGATLAEDIEIHVGAIIVGEVSEREVTGGYPAGDLSYLLD